MTTSKFTLFRLTHHLIPAQVMTGGFIVAVFAMASLAVGDSDSPTSDQRLLNDVKQLASDESEGRGVGTEGLKKAAEFIAESFRESGLDVTTAGGDAFQEFNINDGARLGENNSIEITTPSGKVLDLKQGTDFEVCSFGGTGTVTGDIVFAGYGIVAEDLEYNDFENIDIKDKTVIIVRRNPFQSNPHGPFAVGHGISRHAALTTKLSQAFSRGASAVLFVSDPFSAQSEREQLEEKLAEAKKEVDELTDETSQDAKNAKAHLRQLEKLLSELDDDPLMEFGYGGTRSGESLPAFHISKKVCSEILKDSIGKSLADLEKQIDETGKPASQLLPDCEIAAEASLEIIRVPVRNVVGVLEGEGPNSDETIVIGAHFDHLGRGGEGSLMPNSKEIHNGADDNASGTAGLLELARRLGKREQPLPRRIVFIAFNGEERGLLGAYEYVANPLFPLEKTVAMFNMDMIGRLVDDKLTVFGSGTSSVWETIIDAAAEKQALQLVKKPEGFGPSDHAAFYGKQIPVLHLFTGIHDDYHRPSDDWDKLNIDGMSRVISLLEDLVVATAQLEERPDYVEIAGSAALTRTGSRPYFGSIPDFGQETKGYAISGVAPGSPADEGGLKGGDVIVEMAGKKIGGLDDFDLALRELEAGDQVDVVVLRGTERVPLKVTLATPKN
ncbi:Aminopeptidase YwaD precursor [Thalassoglobus neptunius]|uniref:Aminopeptidase YwaD n=1 Tax=Thalassoglobus neptunius TaxID=1938619 RepID=A0A5C5X5W2_9PLAN|nr:M28 family peptidase [Thalassoglobus neptunius]TWT58158.1 Aminopeptidase YwaD precursor [Thalassoglobus neptunius]